MVLILNKSFQIITAGEGSPSRAAANWTVNANTRVRDLGMKKIMDLFWWKTKLLQMMI